MVKITDDFNQRLKEHIEKIEKNSPIEIVPVIAKKATTYYAWSLVYGLLLSYVLLELILNYYSHWRTYAFIWNFAVFVLFAFVIAKTLRATALLKFILPKAIQKQYAHEKATELFLSEGVFETKSRLGILIAVFESEKTVIVLADKGFKGYVPDQYWPELGQKLAQDFNRHKPGIEFLEALTEIEKDVLHKFKDNQENTNELSDDLRKV